MSERDQQKLRKHKKNWISRIIIQQQLEQTIKQMEKGLRKINSSDRNHFWAQINEWQIHKSIKK